MRIMYLLVFVVLVGFLLVPTEAQNVSKNPEYTEAVKLAKECKKEIDSNATMTEAEKTVAKRNCGTESVKKIVGDTGSAISKLNKLHIKNLIQCESWFDSYKLIPEENFKTQKPRQLADDCITLYKDQVWEYSNPDRLEILLERANELGLFQVAKIKATLPESVLPPLQQLEKGIPKTHIDCKKDFVLIYKIITNKPGCVSLDNVERIIARGWGTLTI